MRVCLTIIFFLCLFVFGTSFVVPRSSRSIVGEAVKRKQPFIVAMRLERNRAVGASYSVGENLPEEIKKCKAINDMVLVERLAQPPQTASGILFPKTDGKDKMHLGKVLSIPDESFTEGGKSIAVKDIFPYKVGDTVFVQVLLSLFLTLSLRFLLSLGCLGNWTSTY
jgi:co-chaperonin GroES (HSP10)